MGAHHLGELCEHLSIEGIGLGQVPTRFGEVAHLTGIDDDHGQAGGGERTRERDFHPARRFQDNQDGTEGTELFDQRGEGGLGMGDRKRSTGTDGNIQARLRDIDTDEDEGTHRSLLSCPALRNAGSVALATVRALQVKRPDDPR